MKTINRLTEERKRALASQPHVTLAGAQAQAKRVMEAGRKGINHRASSRLRPAGGGGVGLHL